MIEGVVIIIVVAGIALAIGLAFGRVVAAPAIRRVADRLEQDEEPGDRPA